VTEQLQEDIVDFLNAIEAACVNFKHRIAGMHGVVSAEDFEKIYWETKEGSKGPYQQTSKKATNNHEIFQTLQKIVKEHGGFWQSKAHKFWFHQGDQDVIDRRGK